MTTLGTPLSPTATKVMLLGSGELGKEVLIALQRLGVETIAVDRYDNAPGHQVAHHARTITMSDPAQLKALIEAERPMLVVPEIEAIATDMLEELEAAGVVRVVPTARAARLTMDREGIRRLAAETLRLPTSPYVFANSLAELRTAIDTRIGYPCVVKPVMSSSGKGQSKIDNAADVAKAWDHAMAGGRVSHGRVIVEGFIDFDYRIEEPRGQRRDLWWRRGPGHCLRRRRRGAACAQYRHPPVRQAAELCEAAHGRGPGVRRGCGAGADPCQTGSSQGSPSPVTGSTRREEALTPAQLNHTAAWGAVAGHGVFPA